MSNHQLTDSITFIVWLLLVEFVPYAASAQDHFLVPYSLKEYLQPFESFVICMHNLICFMRA